jgi:hypothetical protein
MYGHLRHLGCSLTPLISRHTLSSVALLERVPCLQTGPVGFQCSGRLSRPFRDTGSTLP